MKIVYIFAFIMLVGMSYGINAQDYEELTAELRKPSVEVSVSHLMRGFNQDIMMPKMGFYTYDLIRTGVGCGAGVFGGLDQGFTIWSIVQKDITDWSKWVTAAIFTLAWYQQNGQSVGHMCGTFWELLHKTSD